MSIVILLDLLKDVTKKGSITESDRSFLIKKAESLELNIDIINKYIESNNILITGSDDINKKDILHKINSNTYQLFEQFQNNQNFPAIVRSFEERMLDTKDSILIKYYIDSLVALDEKKKAISQFELLSNNLTESERIEFYPDLGDICYELNDFSKALDYYLEIKNLKNTEEKLNATVRSILLKEQFNLISKCRKHKNYREIGISVLKEFESNSQYNAFIQLFESGFENEDELLLPYLWSLYLENHSKKAYKKCKEYSSRIRQNDRFFYIYGCICEDINEWEEALSNYRKAKEFGRDTDKQIDSLLNNVINNKDWKYISLFKDLKNYNEIIENAFISFKSSKDYSALINLFEIAYKSTSDIRKIICYIEALLTKNIELANNKFVYYQNILNIKNDAKWLAVGGKTFDANKNYKKAFELFTVAEEISPGNYGNIIERLYYELHPDKHFTALIKSNDFEKAVEIFDSKIDKSKCDFIQLYEYLDALKYLKFEKEVIIKKGLYFVSINPDGYFLYSKIASIMESLGQYEKAKSYLIKAEKNGLDVAKEIKRINKIIEDKIEEDRVREMERRENEKLREEERVKEMERIEQEKLKEETNKEYHFSSSVSKGGNAIFPEHIYITKSEISWEKKTGLFSKESKTISIAKITQIDIDTALIGSTITIYGKGVGKIVAENFSKSEAKEIKSILNRLSKSL